MLFKTTEKTQDIGTPLKDSEFGIFVDTSGSTGFYKNKNGERLIDSMKKFINIVVSKVANRNIVTWNSVAKNIRGTGEMYSTGGTDPSCIFSNEKTKAVFNSSNVIVFLTDGEVSNSEVTRFATHCKGAVNKQLVVCVLVNPSSNGSENVSVFAPLFDGPNVVCFICNEFSNTGEMKVGFSKGHISYKYPTGSNMTLLELLSYEVNNVYKNVPKDHLIVKETDKYVYSLNMNEFFALALSEKCRWDDIKDIVDSYMDWDIVLRNAKVNNRLADVRDVVNKLRNMDIKYNSDKLKESLKTPAIDLRDSLVRQIKERTGTTDTNDKDVSELREQLKKVIPDARIEESTLNSFIKKNISEHNDRWEKLRRDIHDMEKSSYSLNEFTFSANRAARAKMIDENAVDDLENFLDHSDVPEIECGITLCEGPATLWLKKPENVDDSTNDHCINYPLDYYPKLKNCIVVNPVSGDCAKSWADSKPMKSLYNVPVDGFIPLNFKRNQRFITHQLHKILCFGKMLHHSKMLLLSIVDDNNDDWFMPIKEHIIRELLEFCWTTDTFTEEGEKMTLFDALKKIGSNDETLLRQPLCAALRMIRFAVKYAGLDKNHAVHLARRRLSYYLVEITSSVLKPSGDREKELETYNRYIEKVSSLIFDTLCGIPVQDTNRSANFDSIEILIGKSFSDKTKHIKNLTDELKTDIQSLFNKEFIQAVLYSLTKIKEYNKPLKVYHDLITREKLFREADGYNEESHIQDTINKNKFGKYKKIEDNIHPPYAFYNGVFSSPSKLFFFGDVLIKNKIDKIPLNQFENLIVKELQKKMSEYYGSYIPGEKSGHIPAHKIVAKVLEEEYPADYDHDNEETLIKMLQSVFDEIKKLNDKGNIYNPINHNLVPYLIKQYCDIKKYAQFCIDPIRDAYRMTNTFKIAEELKINGVTVKDNYVLNYDPDKLKKITDLRDIYNIDCDKLFKHLNSNYRLSDVSEDTHTDSAIIINRSEWVDVTNPIDIDRWSSEQKQIADKAVLRDSVDFDSIKYYAGSDISFLKSSPDKAVACFVVFDAKTDKPIVKVSVRCRINVEYKAQFLAFREAPVFMRLLDVLLEEYPEFKPELIIFDGNGVWHPRACGIATHFSVLSGIPAFGVAKNVLYCPGVTRESVYDAVEKNAPNEGDFVDISDETGRTVGSAFNTTGTPKSSIFISAGNGISLETCKKITKRLTNYSVIEPVRHADLYTRSLVKHLD